MRGGGVRPSNRFCLRDQLAELALWEREFYRQEKFSTPLTYRRFSSAQQLLPDFLSFIIFSLTLFLSFFKKVLVGQYLLFIFFNTQKI
jgi:hypothetical protein